MLYDSGLAASYGHNQGTAVYYSATYGMGVNPCSLVVSSAAGGFFAVVDTTGAVIFQQPMPPSTGAPLQCACFHCVRAR